MAEAAVIGLPDTEWGERVAAAVIPAAGQVDPHTIVEELPADVPGKKHPKTIAILEHGSPDCIGDR
ncbi:MAG: hypothetical protein U5K37_05610 [Natrialbaceae archaeon]|nr:hypothetical protein [Natrialbaceae archaeon]